MCILGTEGGEEKEGAGRGQKGEGRTARWRMANQGQSIQAVNLKGRKKQLQQPRPAKAGRSRGTITVRHRGGGHKRRHRVIDFKGRWLRVWKEGWVRELTYDPQRSATVALVANGDNTEGCYRLAAEGRTVGRKVRRRETKEEEVRERAPGTHLPLWRVGVGQPFYALELKPGKGAQVGRSGGTERRVVSSEGRAGGRVRVRLPSGEQRRVPGECWCIAGKVRGGSRWRTAGSKAAKGESGRFPQGKAGRTRWLGRRPTVRGVARNPVDHPHGGGEGKTSGGQPSVTPWGKPRGRRTGRGAGRIFVVVPRGR